MRVLHTAGDRRAGSAAPQPPVPCRAGSAPFAGAFDDLARLAAALCAAPVAVIALGEAQGVRIAGSAGLSSGQAARIAARCARVRQHELPALVATALPGTPLHLCAGVALADGGVSAGTLWVFDHTPRSLDARQLDLLAALARQALASTELQRLRAELAESRRARQALENELRTFQRELVSANVKLLREARQDALSGLPNRRALEDLRERFGRGEFDAMGRFAVVAIDIDHFKRINDSHGHAVGDEVIRRLGQALRGCVRGQDVAGRHGGEEFVAFLPGADLDGARRMAERLREAIARIDAPCAFTVSIGVAAGSIGADDLDAVMERADRALYRAKREGRDRIVVAQGSAG
ncbi:MAG: diguanylate cyclase [Rehaibacterium terrae]|uniref:GGDEF domain-containing protein n=1 Tax=Rehaibacterium terrae TaxID=1341696 RepID=UPI00391DF497